MKLQKLFFLGLIFINFIAKSVAEDKKRTYKIHYQSHMKNDDWSKSNKWEKFELLIKSECLKDLRNEAPNDIIDHLNSKNLIPTDRKFIDFKFVYIGKKNSPEHIDTIFVYSSDPD